MDALHAPSTIKTGKAFLAGECRICASIGCSGCRYVDVNGSNYLDESRERPDGSPASA